MLSFEMSAVDLVLIVAIVILFLLYLRFSSNFEWLTQGRKIESNEKANDKTEGKNEVKDVTEEVEGDSLISAGCPYGFGYLRKLPGGVSVPPACLGCSRMLVCRYEAVVSKSE